jgi:hypothetical protein
MHRRILALAAVVPFFPSAAATVTFGGVAQVRLGYVDNPFLERNAPGGTIQVGGTITPRLTRSTALGKTVLTGSYTREQYASHYDYSDAISADLEHSQQLSERLKGTLHAAYSNSLNPFIDSNVDPSQIDLLTVGQRSRRISGDGSLDWTPSAIESVSVSVNAAHSTYGQSRTGALATDYTSYGASGSYMRAFGARTKLGLQLVYSHSDSGFYGTSDSYQPNLIVQRALSQFWAFNGSVGGIFQKSGGLVSSTSHSLGFNGSLCGTYPKYTLCFTGSRQTSASGIGGLRTELRFGTTFSYRIDQRSRLTFNGIYSDSKSGGNGLTAVPAQTFAQGGLDYSRDLNQRISAGFGARYQWRDYRGLSKAHGMAATVNISARFGRQ